MREILFGTLVVLTLWWGIGLEIGIIQSFDPEAHGCTFHSIAARTNVGYIIGCAFFVQRY